MFDGYLKETKIAVPEAVGNTHSWCGISLTRMSDGSIRVIDMVSTTFVKQGGSWGRVPFRDLNKSLTAKEAGLPFTD